MDSRNTFSYRKITLATALAAAALAAQPALADEYETIDAVSVTAEALKIDVSTQETPQTVNVISGKTLEEGNIRKLDDALRYTPGFWNQFGTDYDTNWIRMRGFEASLLVNGQRQYKDGYFDTSIEPYGIEAVEVLQGPASSLYGDSMPGGVVNVVTKKPTKTPQHSVSISGGSNKYVQGGIDFSDFATEDGSKRYRIVAMANREDSVLDDVDGSRYYFAPSFTADIDERSSITFMASYLKDDKIANNGFFPAYGTLFSRNGHHISPSTNYGDPDDAYDKEQFNIGWELKLGFNDVWSYKQSANFYYQDFYLHSTAAYGYVDTAADNIQAQIPRYTLVNDGTEKSFTFDNNLTAEWESGDFSNTFQVGFDYQYHENVWMGNGTSGQSVGTIDPLNPKNFVDIGTVLSLYNNNITKKQLGIYAQGQTTWNEAIVAKGGIRFDRFNIDAYNEDPNPKAGSKSDSISDSNVSWNAGLMYLSPVGASPYVNYSEAFFAAGSLQAAYNSAWDYSYLLDKPITTKQIEAGVKFTPDWLDGYMNVAWYHLKQENALAQTMIAGTPQMRQVPEMNTQGVELEAHVALAKYWTVDASYSYMDATQGSGDKETRADYMPHHTATAFVAYDFTGLGVNGLTVGAGARYLGTSIDNVYTNQKIPSVTLWDMRLSWLINKNWTINGSVTNIADKEFVTGCYNNMCYYGEGRVARATLTYAW